MLHALMLGVSESFFGACAVALGHTDTALAILVTLPLFAGAVAQAFTGPLVLAFGNRKRFVVTGAVLQALSHLGLIAVAWLGVSSLAPLLALVVVYFVSGMAIVPAWGAWMGSLTEQIDRQRYFALRSALLSTALLVGFLWAGYHLHAAAPVHQARAAHEVSRAYALLFGVGFIARAASSITLMLQHEPSAPARDSLLRVWARTRSALRGDGRKLVLALGLLMFGAQLSIPFYAPYMLKTLALGYDGFALLCGIQLLVKAIALGFAHRVCARVGLSRMLIGSIATVSLVAWLWGAPGPVNGTLIGTLVLAQILSGLSWAAYEFSSFQLLLGASKPSHRVEFLAFAASVGGLFQLGGALFGSVLLTQLSLGYREVFHVSAVLRVLPLCLLLPLLPAWRRTLSLVVGVARVAGRSRG
jgi:MFS family permease